MTPNKFTLIRGGRDEIERNLVRALFEGDGTEVNRLSAQLDAIEKQCKPDLKLVQSSGPPQENQHALQINPLNLAE